MKRVTRHRDREQREIVRFEYFLLNKPYGVLCQFTDSLDRPTLSLYGPFPRDVYPVGRLDADSEGLVLLTNDGKMKHRLMDPRFRHERRYLVQVERSPSVEALSRLSEGILLGTSKTLPANISRLEEEPPIFSRTVPIRYRKTVPTAWLSVTLREGRNRQVRRMMAHVGHPALRLIRVAIGPLTLDGLMPGESRILTAEEIRRLREYAG